ncbi:hypothetical protein AAZV13_02G242150 [Glycine max]
MLSVLYLFPTCATTAPLSNPRHKAMVLPPPLRWSTFAVNGNTRRRAREGRRTIYDGIGREGGFQMWLTAAMKMRFQRRLKLLGTQRGMEVVRWFVVIWRFPFAKDFKRVRVWLDLKKKKIDLDLNLDLFLESNIMNLDLFLESYVFFFLSISQI